MKLDYFWYQRPSSLHLLLLPFTLFFLLIVMLRRLAYRYGILKKTKHSVPVIVIGNITVGGTGKTPLTIAVAHALLAAGFRPGIVSRGYKSQAPYYPFLVMPTAKASEVGDEPLLLAKHSHCPVVISPKRNAAVNELIQHHQCNIIISDDGLQHYAMERDIEIIVIDGERRFGNQLMLPAGPLRESMRRLSEADFLICNGQAQPNEYAMQLVPNNFHNLAHEDIILPVTDFLGKSVYAIAGIGNPNRFFDTLTEMGLSIIPQVFADHHQYTAKDLDFDGEVNIIMTEKDAVKCQAFANYRHWYLPVTAQLAPEFIELLLKKILQLR